MSLSSSISQAFLHDHQQQPHWHQGRLLRDSLSGSRDHPHTQSCSRNPGHPAAVGGISGRPTGISRPGCVFSQGHLGQPARIDFSATFVANSQACPAASAEPLRPGPGARDRSPHGSVPAARRPSDTQPAGSARPSRAHSTFSALMNETTTFRSSVAAALQQWDRLPSAGKGLG